MARQHLDQGVEEISLADSTGMADPRSVAEICSAVVVMLDQMGIRSGIDATGIAAVSRSLEDYLGRRFSGKMHRLLARDDIRILGR